MSERDEGWHHLDAITILPWWGAKALPLWRVRCSCGFRRWVWKSPDALMFKHGETGS